MIETLIGAGYGTWQASVLLTRTKDKGTLPGEIREWEIGVSQEGMLAQRRPGGCNTAFQRTRAR